MYKFLKRHDCTGYFEECIYDECPSMGKYTKKISLSFNECDTLDVDIVSSKIVQLNDNSCYGASVRGTNVYLYLDVDKLTHSGVLYELNDEEEQQHRKVQLASAQYKKALYDVACAHDFIHDAEIEKDELAFEHYKASIIAAIHAQAGLILAQV